MEDLEVLLSSAMANRKKCELEANAYSLWLDQLVPANLILVVGAGLLSLIAGASILVDQQIISKTAAGIIALVSSAFTLIHNRLGCDQHQAECRKLQSFYQGLAFDYGNLETVTNPAEFRKKLDSLNNELALTLKGSSAQPSAVSYAKAKRQIEVKTIQSIK